MDEIAPRITGLLSAWRAGDSAALDALMPMVYEQLRTIAARYMRRERSDHTLRPTALVNEAYLRLLSADVPWQDRAHFMAIAALTMRRILVDHAKSLHRGKRGGGALKLPLDDPSVDPILVSQTDPARMLDLDEALAMLARQDARKARLLELIYFGGLNGEEAAEVLGISVPTVNRDLKLSKAWLRQRLQTNPASDKS
jgi:RNA polymerase sigma factor (TIGR02999 family)